ncbi:DUF2339 domain-containing protein [Alsobacter soli]|uniref:DUF2339 domain-containing protein n=1 Tax=Alsobacter soli TaxID=2109933 RepID=A0A2T1HND9_9HYPH|nr:DUF2339 domain-containing protein [Alsobacter soli]PSC03158.1 DUF2339 domain-containing protein [Alsobacter soli]
MEYVLLVLMALAIPLLGLVGFFRTVSLGRQILLLEARLARAERALAEAGAAGERTAAATEREEQPEQAAATLAEEEQEEVAAAEPQGAAGPPAAVAAGTRLPPRSLEETLGTRWAVWLGGLALALGGLFLVRYSIEQNLFGPGARIAAGGLFAAALLAVGEYLRRSERGLGPAAAVIPTAHAPSVLTAAGTISAFGVVYAAHALYGMIGPAIGFTLMGAIALATLAAAALHGPALASLGLVGAFAVPLLVDSHNPEPWPVVLYLIAVAAAGYAQARLRRWIWIARATALGAVLWGLAFLGLRGPDLAAMVAHVLVQTALAAFFLALEPYRGAEDADAAPDPLALGALAAFAALAGLGLQDPELGSWRLVLGGGAFLVQFGTALRVAPAAGGALFAAAVAGAMLWGWPVLAEAAAEGPTVLPGAPSRPPMPTALWLFLLSGTLCGGALAALGWARLMRSAALPRLAAALYAAAATVGPLALMTLAWHRIDGFDRSIPFALAAGGLGLAFVVAARTFRTGEETACWASLVGLEGFAAGALGALALGLTMALEKGSLTAALALSALGAAWVTTQARLGLLRYAIGVLGVVVAARLGWNTALIGDDIGSLPVLNWLLWAYGVPALAFALASVLLRRQRDDQVVALTEALALALAALLVFFEIRHALTGRIDSPRTDHLEMGLQVVSSLLFGLVTVKLEAFRRSAVLRIGSYVFGGLALAGSLAGLVAMENPLFSRRDEVIGGAVFNSLLLAYLMPALAAFWLGRAARGRRPAWFVGAAVALGAALQLLWTVLEIRRLFQGSDINFLHHTSEAELYTYTAAFLLMGLVLLAYGVLRGSRPVRLVSGAYILLAIGKAFLVDMSGLEGPLRALSFIGLGAALVGIGLVYQKWIFGRPPSSPAAPDAPSPAE